MRFKVTKAYKGEETREKILLEAIDLFSSKGFDQVSLKMIGDNIGISQSAVAQHFGSKRNIIFRVREVVTRSNQTYVDSKISAYDKSQKQLVDYAFANIEWGFKNRKLAQIIVLTYYFAFMDEDFQTAQANAVKMATDRVEKYVISYFREHGIENLSQTREIANRLHQYLLGHFIREISYQSRMPNAKTLRLHLEETVSVLLKTSL